ncbi:MAG: putative heme iron utilization protein [Crocinitomix sp.]|jgi:putative heme iron utilization protein
MSKDAFIAARALFNSKDFGILSTISVKLEGFPFGSVVPYCLDDTGAPIIYISTIAQHTKNIGADQRCSLTILRDNDDIQAHGRISIVGNMELLGKDEKFVEERYFRHFSNAKGYGGTHSFSFYKLQPITVRYIGGFGAIHWIEPVDFLNQNPFAGAAETAVTEHMNKDHQDSMVKYCQQYKNMELGNDDQLRMVGIDSAGFDLFVNQQKVRFEFPAPVANAQEARAALVAMSKGLK